MSNGFNRVTLFGNLGAEPELRHPASGNPLLTFRLATTEVYFDKDKNKQERTEWHSVVLFGTRAVALSRLLSKGSAVLVEGRLHTSSYEKDGVKRYKTDVVASDVCIGHLRGGRSSGVPAAAELEDSVPF